MYNSRTTKNYTEYLKRYYPEVDIDSILHDAGITGYQLDDQGHWFSQQQVDLFQKAVVQRTGNPDIAREVGRYGTSSKAIGAILPYIKGFITPVTAYMMLERLYLLLSRACTIHVKKFKHNKVEVIVKPKPNVDEKPYQCKNRWGAFEGMTKPFSNKLATVEHPTCIHKGGDCCRYIITWEKSPAFMWRQIRSYAIPIGIAVYLTLFFALPGRYWLISMLSCTLLVVSVSLYSEYREKKELLVDLENQGYLASSLLDQTEISYNNALLSKELGQAFSSILDIDELFKVTMKTIEKRLDFDRGMIMLANKEMTRLVYTAGFGYKPTEEEFLKQAEFRLDNPESKGQFVLAFKRQKSFLISDIKEAEKDLSKKSLEFAKRMGALSFICVPIVYEGCSEGILAVDNVQSKRKLTESDMSLLTGIATQIAISINNAKAYEKVRESEERFRALSDNAPDIIYTLGIDGLFTYVNPAWGKILGHKKKEVIGKYFTDFVKEDGNANFGSFLNGIKHNKKRIKNANVVISNKDGYEQIFTMNNASNFDSEGNMTGFVGTLKDITRQRNLEAQLRHASKMEAVGTLTGGISHDFNNIIQALAGYNQLLMMKKKETDPDWRYLSHISDLTQRATSLIQQLMIFSRKMESKLKPIILNNEIRKVCDLLGSTISKMIAIELDMDDDLHIISGDPVQIQQIIMNLVVNAKDAMPDGGRINIKTENTTIAEGYSQGNFEIKTGRYVLMSISDTGYGMDKETLEHIFDPFFTTKAVGEGTGLGLSVVYGIVRNHGGYIICESELGDGTTFRIYLPSLSVIDEKEITKPEQMEELLIGKETILLVDDEETLLEVGQNILTYHGYTTLTAESGEKAIEIFKKEKNTIHLVILDLMMPGMGGYKCLSELRRIDPEAKIIISSGFMTSVQEENTLKEGAVGFIKKPYQLLDLLKKIRNFLDGKT